MNEPTWIAGIGVPHPVGGYDDFREHPLGGTVFLKAHGYHRLDGPALVWTEGNEWYRNGVRHRADGPAIEWADGMQEWYVHGVQHRLDGPAIIDVDGGYVYFVHGQKHRTDGPASVWRNGRQEWWVEGKRHRLDGPAVVQPAHRNGPGFTEFYIDDVGYAAEEHAAITASLGEGVPLEWALAYLRGEAS